MPTSDPTRPRIRAARPEDAASLAELAARTFRDTYGPSNLAEDVEAYLAEHMGAGYAERELEDPRLTTLLAEADGRLVGYAVLRAAPAPPCIAGRQPIEIARFYVDRAWHGRGVAQALMAATIRAAGPAVDVVWLVVWQQNGRAIAFYRQCGFEVAGAQPFQMGSQLQEDYVMARVL